MKRVLGVVFIALMAAACTGLVGLTDVPAPTEVPTDGSMPVDGHALPDVRAPTDKYAPDAPADRGSDSRFEASRESGEASPVDTDGDGASPVDTDGGEASPVDTDGDAGTLSWTIVRTGCATILAPRLSKAGLNAVTIIPLFSGTGTPSFYLLGSAEDLYGNYQYVYQAEDCYAYSDDYFWGITLANDNSSLFAWTNAGDNGKVAIATSSGTGSPPVVAWTFNMWQPFTSVTARNGADIFMTYDIGNACTSSSPSGLCIYHSTGGTASIWSSNNYGAIQVATDSTVGTLYALDNQNSVWYFDGTIPQQTTMEICMANGGGTLVADQIAAKAGTVYAIQDEAGAGGNVYWYSPGTSSCWAGVGSDGPSLLSIATDNSTSSPVGVWGTDAINNIWAACPGMACVE